MATNSAEEPRAGSRQAGCRAVAEQAPSVAACPLGAAPPPLPSWIPWHVRSSWPWRPLNAPAVRAPMPRAPMPRAPMPVLRSAQRKEPLALNSGSPPPTVASLGPAARRWRHHLPTAASLESASRLLRFLHPLPEQTSFATGATPTPQSTSRRLTLRRLTVAAAYKAPVQRKAEEQNCCKRSIHPTIKNSLKHRQKQGLDKLEQCKVSSSNLDANINLKQDDLILEPMTSTS